MATRLLIVGWDAADWQRLDPLLITGRMPRLAQVLARGVRSDLATLQPILSPLLWTSVATGKTADHHGILNFLEPRPTGDGVRIAASTSRQTKALWNILSQSERMVHVVGWYASHPAEPVRGICVSNMLQEGAPARSTDAWPLPEGVVHPAHHAAAIADCRRHPDSIGIDELARYIPDLRSLRSDDPRPRQLAAQLARMHAVHQAALATLRTEPAWNAAMVFYETIDTVGHHFMQFVPPRMRHVTAAEMRAFSGVMDRIYETHDRMLGELLDAAGPDTTVMLLSDHGFHSDHRRPVIDTSDLKERAAQEAQWHRPLGVLVMAGPGVRGGAIANAPGLLDVTPTALALMGLPAGRDMQGRVLAECLDAGPVPEPIESWDDVEGDAAMHPAAMRQNPFDSQDAIQQLIDLGYMAAPTQGVQLQLDLVRRETRFNHAVVLAFTGRAAEAVPILEGLVEACPTETRYRADLAKMLYAAGRHEACIEALQRLTVSAAEDPAMQLLHAASLIQLGKTQEASRRVDALMAAGSVPPEDLLQLGQTLTALGREEAAATLARAATHEPDNPLVAMAQAREALLHGRHADVIDHTLRAAELRQALPEAHFLLGISLAWLGDLKHARTSLEFTITLQPGMVDAHRFLAIACRATGDPEAAERHDARANGLLERILRVRPSRGPGEAETAPWGWRALARSLDQRLD
jgi:Flp pilus assembly protein TadD